MYLTAEVAVASIGGKGLPYIYCLQQNSLMKQSLVFVLLAFCGLHCAGQRIRFTDTSNKWSILYSHVDFPGSFTEDRADYASDTLINAVQYHQLSGPLPLAVREDTVARKIYFRFLRAMESFGLTITPTDTLEHLLFDYDPIVGDTFKVDYGRYHSVHYVATVDSVRLGGNYYKTWYMSNVAGPYWPYTFVEGIGTTNAPHFSVNNATFESGWTLRCFTNNGQHPRCSPAIGYFDNDTSCYRWPVGISSNASPRQLSPLVIPNPGGKQSIIQVPNQAAHWILSVTDATGRKVFCADFEGKSEIPIGQFITVPAIYYYTLQDAATGHRYTGRFIFQ